MMMPRFDNPTLQRSNGGEQRPSELALRVTILGGIAVVIFAVLFFRVWFMQVLTGDDYLAEANENRTREVVLPAPRGEIQDRNGELLVGNRSSLVLKVDPRELHPDVERRQAQVRRIAELADLPARRVKRAIRDQVRELPGSMVTVEHDVDHDVVFYVAENEHRFPALAVERLFVRRYTDGGRAGAHVVGSVGEVNQEELEMPSFGGVTAGEMVGKGGVEVTYDEYLRGEPGETELQVDAMGQTKGQISSTSPEPGGNLRLSIDAEIQAAGNAALSGTGLAGGFAVLEVDDGELLGMGSSPSFDPAIFTRSITPRTYEALIAEENGAPLLNRVIQGLYPTGSSYKPITAVAALESDVIDPQTIVNDTGSITVGDQRFANAGDAVFGPIDLPSALRVSSDVYFYLLGMQMNETPLLQQWSRRLGFGEPTGIDLPGEAEGLVPTPEWRNQLAAESDEVDPWTVGHNIQLAIGQGDLQANPLQMAVAYAAIANGGRMVTPHLGRSIEDAAGRIVREFEPEPRRRLEIARRHRESILDGLHQAAQQPGGTAYATFGDFPVQIAGKTGTAERPPHADQAWFAALAPYPDPEVAVVVTLEEGGFGADTAAPAAEQILSAYFADEIAAASQEEAPDGDGDAAPEAAG